MKEPFRFGHAAPARYRVGPLAGHIDCFAAWLEERGYRRESARHKVRVITDLSLWLQRRKLEIESLDECSVKRFFRNRRRYDPLRCGDAAAVGLLLQMLRSLGAIRHRSAKESGGPAHPIEREFELYLTQERRLSASTLHNTLPYVRRFLAERFGTDPAWLREVEAADITHFVLRHAHAQSPSRAKLMVGALRSFFRFLHLRGDIATDLAAAVPTVASWRLSGLPKSVGPDDVRRLLRSCNRRMPAGRRDYAVLLLLARLGLRAGEVAALSLDDVDWEAGQIMVRGKGARRDLLPLPKDVGKALVAYLRHGRPACPSRRVFLTARAPIRDVVERRLVGGIVQRAFQRAGLDAPHKGAHVLRHSLACDMLRHGASLAEIGQILRHVRVDTTAIYAKVDLTALSALARPWPGGAA